MMEKERMNAVSLSWKMLGFCGNLHFGVWIVEGSVEHDDGEGEDEGCVPFLEDVGVLSAVVSCKSVHNPVNLHCFPGQPEAPKELPECLDQEQVGELMTANKLSQDLLVELL